MSVLLAYPLIGLTYVGVALGGLPRLRMNRATIALVGAVALVAVGVLPLEAAIAALDADTLILLFAMMVTNVHLERAGFFGWIGAWVIGRARSPRVLLAWIMFAAAVLSALFLNDTIVLMFTPLVLQVTMALRRNPLPYLVGLATAANIGSTATITGNPQNMLIGQASHISFVSFAAALGPIAAVGLALAWGVVVLVYRGEFGAGVFAEKVEIAAPIDPQLLRKSLAVVALMVVALLGGVPVPLAALVAAAVLLVTRQTDPERIFAEVDWSLLVFFGGLFVVTGAVNSTGLSAALLDGAGSLSRAGVAPLAVVTVMLSNIVSNVPAVLLFRPIIPQLPDPQRMWLTLAMASTLAGNLTLLGSVANLIVAESARTRGVRLSFGEYLKAGVPITVITLIVGIIGLSV